MKQKDRMRAGPAPGEGNQDSPQGRHRRLLCCEGFCSAAREGDVSKVNRAVKSHVKNQVLTSAASAGSSILEGHGHGGSALVPAPQAEQCPAHQSLCN